MASSPLPPQSRAIAYDQLQPVVVASHNLSAGRPCERRDPSPLAPKVKKGLCSSAETRVRAAAMSAIALTLGSLRSQGRLIENSICDSPALSDRAMGVLLRDDGLVPLICPTCQNVFAGFAQSIHASDHLATL